MRRPAVEPLGSGVGAPGTVDRPSERLLTDGAALEGTVELLGLPERESPVRRGVRPRVREHDGCGEPRDVEIGSIGGSL